VLVAVTLHARLVVYRSDDGGGTWRMAATLGVGQQPSLCMAAALSVSFATPTAWWAAANGVVYRTTSGGHSWTQSSVPRGGCGHPEVQAVDARTAWIQGDSGLRVTRDGGAHWRAVIPHA